MIFSWDNTTPLRIQNRKDQPQAPTQKHSEPSRWVLDLLDEILRTQFATEEQMVQSERECGSWWFGLGTGPKPQEIPVEDGAHHRDLPRKWRPGQKGPNEDPEWWIREAHPQAVSHSDKTRLRCSTSVKNKNKEQFGELWTEQWTVCCVSVILVRELYPA